MTDLGSEASAPSTFFSEEGEEEGVEVDSLALAVLPERALVEYKGSEAFTAKLWRSLRRAMRQAKLRGLTSKFGGNLAFASCMSFVDVKEEAGIRGLPLSFREAAAHRFPSETATGEQGPWRLTADCLRHLHNVSVREALWRSFASRCAGVIADNRNIVVRMLNQRRALALEAGFPSHATAVAQQMETFGCEVAVDTWLRDLAEMLRSPVDHETALLKAFAASCGNAGPLMPWDLDYWQERYSEEVLGIYEEELRDYFALPNVLEALRYLCLRVFGLRLVPVDLSDQDLMSETWYHFQVLDMELGQTRGQLVLDPFGFEDERESIWTSPQSLELPVLEQIMVLRLRRPKEGEPTLMGLRDVQVLFHEFGRMIESMLRLPTLDPQEDSSEFVALLMERWMLHKDLFQRYAVHHTTGKRLPERVRKSLVKRAQCREARSTLWSVFFARLDLELHGQRPRPWTKEDVLSNEHEVLRGVLGREPDSAECWTCLFGEAFQGDELAAKVYSYVWGKVLAFDAFAAFEEVWNPRTYRFMDPVSRLGARFRRAMGRYPKRPFLEAYREFRGRDPSVDAFREYALVDGARWT